MRKSKLIKKLKTINLMLFYRYAKFKVNLKRDVVLTASCIVVTQPFHVISIRMMAQFVGRETLYKSLLGSMAEIYRHEGILGFFSGLMPKLLCDLACVVLSSSTVYLLNKYVIKDKLGRQYSAAFTQVCYFKYEIIKSYLHIKSLFFRSLHFQVFCIHSMLFPHAWM